MSFLNELTNLEELIIINDKIEKFEFFNNAQFENLKKIYFNCEKLDFSYKLNLPSLIKFKIYYSFKYENKNKNKKKFYFNNFYLRQ